jgi:formylglycine-generating enzyme required for sulfatase activity
MVMVYVPAGKFEMGSNDGRRDEQPVHTVALGGSWIDRTEITNGQYERCVKAGACEPPVESDSRTRDTYYGDSDYADSPVVKVGWPHARMYCEWAGARLPTEAEWEYAAGGGAVHQRWPGTDSEREPGEYAWYSGNFAGKSRPVGLKIPNLFRIYDMGGNVGEWCADRYGEDYYRKSPVLDPKGPEVGERRVVRGGSWLSSPYDTRSARRSGRSPATRSRTIGFRAAADLSPERPAGFTAPRKR